MRHCAPSVQSLGAALRSEDPTLQEGSSEAPSRARAGHTADVRRDSDSELFSEHRRHLVLVS